MVVLFNLFYMAFFCWRCLEVTEATQVSTADMIAAAVVFFGGELFVLAGKQVIERKKVKKEAEEQREE